MAAETKRYKIKIFGLFPDKINTVTEKKKKKE